MAVKPKPAHKSAPAEEAAESTTAAPKTKPRPKRPAATKAKPAAKATPKTAPKSKPASKTAPKSKTKAAPKPKTEKAPRQAPVRETNVHGFIPGGDSAIIVDALVAGGESREDITDRAREALPSTKTRKGNEKNLPSMISALLKRLQDRGYTIEQSYRVVPPADVQAEMKKAAAAEKRKAARAAK